MAGPLGILEWGLSLIEEGRDHTPEKRNTPRHGDANQRTLFTFTLGRLQPLSDQQALCSRPA